MVSTIGKLENTPNYFRDINIDLASGMRGLSRIRQKSIADTSIISKTARNVQKTVVTMPPSKRDMPMD